ncbi:MAG: VWA domain-containing protein [Anaerolineae bacterium]|nr:VWA domain-containing protein [Anaerolineae bacterium]
MKAKATIAPEKDYYAALGLQPTTTLEELKRVYRDLARQHHPDVSGGDAEVFRCIQEAYEVLRDPVLRQAYDRQRAARGLGREAPLECTLTLSSLQLVASDAPQMLYALLDLRPRPAVVKQRLPLNLALVIDRSTSMQGARIGNVKLAALNLFEGLSEHDRLAVIAFSDHAEVVADSTSVRQIASLRSAVANLTTGGGTEILQGLRAGLEQVRRFADRTSNNHVVLLTDGRTYGDEETCLVEARQAQSENIGISTLGIGDDWNDLFLDALARHGGGMCQYISSPAQLQDLLLQHIRGLSQVTLNRLALNVNLPPWVQLQAAFRAAPFMELLDAKPGCPFSLGQVGEEPLSLLIELVVHQPDAGERRVARLDFEGLASDGFVTLRRDVLIQFVAQAFEMPEVPGRLLNTLSRLSIFRLQERAWQVLEQGDVRQATHLLESAATRLFEIGHRELGQVALVEAERVQQGIAPTSRGRKQVRYGTRALIRS